MSLSTLPEFILARIVLYCDRLKDVHELLRTCHSIKNAITSHDLEKMRQNLILRRGTYLSTVAAWVEEKMTSRIPSFSINKFSIENNHMYMKVSVSPITKLKLKHFEFNESSEFSIKFECIEKYRYCEDNDLQSYSIWGIFLLKKK